VAATLLLALAVPLYLKWLAPGFSTAERALAARAIYVMLPAITLMGLATLAGAILQVYRRFARPALATAIYNVTFVAVLLGAPLAWVVGGAAWGVTAGALAAFLLQSSLVWRFRPRSSPPEPPPTAVPEPAGAPTAHPPATSERAPAGLGVADVARLAGPLAAGYAAHHIILLIDRAMATTLGAGSVATLNYAYRLALVVGQLSGLAVSTALFPRMAEQAANHDQAGLRSSLAGALRFVWMIGLPAASGLILLRTPLVQLIFEHGAFDRAATAEVSGVLIWYAVAVLADALCQPLWRVLYAQRTAWTVLAVNSLQTGIRILFNLALIGSLGYNGLAFSAAIGLTVQLVILGLLVRRRLGAFLTGRWWQGAFWILLATAAAALAVYLAAAQLSGSPALVTLLISGALGGAIYLSILRLVTRYAL
jgi:putative peptidoglycan lipid II flippase